MTRFADVTVAIATRDRPVGLARCLDAVLSNSTLPREVIVVDQGSSGRSRDVVEERRAARPALIYLRQAPRGLSASRNEAIRHVGCATVAATDDDCIPDVGWVAAIDAALASSSALAAVTGRVIPLESPRAGLYPVASRPSRDRAEYAGRALPWLVGTGANLAVRRQWLDRIGFYDERLGAGSHGGAGEDMDYIRRLLRAGGRILYEPSAIVWHEQQDRERRAASRLSYGRGIGACCAFWLQEGDMGALEVLGRWVAMRARRLARFVREREKESAGDELRVLVGTAAGLVYGFRSRTLPPRKPGPGRGSDS